MKRSLFCAEKKQTDVILPLEKISNNQLLPLVHKLLDCDTQQGHTREYKLFL